MQTQRGATPSAVGDSPHRSPSSGGDTPSLGYFFCLLLIVWLMVAGVGVGILAAGDLLRWLWRVLP